MTSAIGTIAAIVAVVLSLGLAIFARGADVPSRDEMNENDREVESRLSKQMTQSEERIVRRLDRMETKIDDLSKDGDRQRR